MREDAVIEKDEKNTGEQIKGGNLVVISKGKRRKPTKRTKKKKVVKKTYEIVTANNRLIIE